MSDSAHDFRERFDTAAAYIVLAMTGLASAVWIGVTIRRLYY